MQKIYSSGKLIPFHQMSQLNPIAPPGFMFGSSGRIYPLQTHGADYPTIEQQQQAKRYNSDLNLGPGGFRSRSRFFVDQNPRSRENVMRDALKELLGETFVKIRPAFLLNPSTKRRLELDAYNEKLRLAVEFDGPQVRDNNKIQKSNQQAMQAAVLCIF